MAKSEQLLGTCVESFAVLHICRFNNFSLSHLIDILGFSDAGGTQNSPIASLGAQERRGVQARHGIGQLSIRLHHLMNHIFIQLFDMLSAQC